MTKLNRAWHEAHRMPPNPTPTQRIAWHLEHAAHCACRPIPQGVLELMHARGMAAPRPPVQPSPDHRPRKATGDG